MASEDVIDLGSSDDEAEPAPKKMKPRQNAMVHIHNKLPGVTIKPKPVVPIIQGIVGKGITLTKINNPANKNLPNKAKSNGKYIQKTVIKPIQRKELLKPLPVQSKSTINAISLMKKLNNSQLLINKVPSSSNIMKNPIRVVQNLKAPKLNNLPPSITITKTAGSSKRPAVADFLNARKKPKSDQKSAVGTVLTVELDDDEVPEPSKTAGPQWYLRPEQLTETPELEKKNNAEPEPSKLIEITIEDSPVKPFQNKQTSDVGTERAITLDDSPVRHATKKAAASAISDNEDTGAHKVPCSKKKLEYPKEATIMALGTIEIEIEPMESNICNKSNNGNNKEVSIVREVVEVEESPVKPKLVHQETTPKKEQNLRPQLKVIDLEIASTSAQKSSEFHPVYQSFIDLCFKLENSDDMQKIVEKKIKAYYRQVPKEYTESEQFIDMVASKVLAMKTGPEKMYLYIKDIVDELNLQRKMAKSQPLGTETKTSDPEPFLYGEDSEFDAKRQRQIRKLEKTLKKLHRAIQKLEEQEVDFDDEEDSVYLLTERYKERMVRVHAKFCQLTNTKMPSEPRVQLDARLGHPTGPVKRLEKWVNRKVPIGTILPFPDFHDVLRCVREANDEDKLGWNEADIMEEARDLFTRCGKKLQRRRQENEWRLAASRISVDIDPAEGNESLKKKLEENNQLATKKEAEVFNKYADRQSQLKLEAEEIGDKEADESPVESEDDEPTEEKSTLENKEKRKERLKRLIQEKSKRTVDAKTSESKESEKDQSSNNIVLDDVINSESKETGLEKNGVDSDDKKKGVDLDNDNVKPKITESIHSISDGSDKVDTDMDELHLLQKFSFNSGTEINSSTLDSSDTDTPIDISDTLHSGSDNKGKSTDDVISIENSSYSESEVDNDKNKDENKDDDDHCIESNAVDNGNAIEIVSSAKITAQTNNDEYDDSVGNILLASSDVENGEHKDKSSVNVENCVNLKLSIGDTIVQGVDAAIVSLENQDPKSLEITNSVGQDTVNIKSTDQHIEESEDTNRRENNNIDKDIVTSTVSSDHMTEGDDKNSGKLQKSSSIENKDTLSTGTIEANSDTTENLPPSKSREIEENDDLSAVLMESLEFTSSEVNDGRETVENLTDKNLTFFIKETEDSLDVCKKPLEKNIFDEPAISTDRPLAAVDSEVTTADVIDGVVAKENIDTFENILEDLRFTNETEDNNDVCMKPSEKDVFDDSANSTNRTSEGVHSVVSTADVTDGVIAKDNIDDTFENILEDLRADLK